MPLWPYALGGVLLALPLAASAKRKSGGAADKPEPFSVRQKRFRCGFAATGLGDDFMRFFEQVARRESNFNPKAWNNSDYEKNRAREAASSAGVVSGVDFDSGAWGFGSRGLFQLLGPYVATGSKGLRFPREMINPEMAYDPGVSIAAALDFAIGLMGWNNFAGTWASLNVGWGNPSKMGDASSLASSAKKMEDRAAKLGWSRGWANEKVPAIRRLTHTEMKALANTARSYYAAC